jgi:glyoxylase-like metal-dependent hydrolase (beta-lactamase superfamily II)
VAALHLLGPYLEGFKAAASADDDFAMAIMLRHGVPSELATALGSVGASFRAFGSGGRVTLPLHDGEELEFVHRRLRVMHRPGHSPSDTIFLDEERGLLIGGDHLLARISSNPLISRPLEGDPPGPGADRPRALLTYMESLRLTRELDASTVLPGHGDPVLDHASLIDERFRMHDRRARKLREMLDPEPLSAYELASRVWGNVAVTQAFLTISEVLGHLDLLIAEGSVHERDDGEVIRFALAATS